MPVNLQAAKMLVRYARFDSAGKRDLVGSLAELQLSGCLQVVRLTQVGMKWPRKNAFMSQVAIVHTLLYAPERGVCHQVDLRHRTDASFRPMIGWLLRDGPTADSDRSCGPFLHGQYL